MPRISRGQKTRLNLEMSEAVREQLEGLRDKTNADSLAEVVRRSLAVYDFLWKQREKGAEIVVRGPDRIDREIVLL